MSEAAPNGAAGPHGGELARLLQAELDSPVAEAARSLVDRIRERHAPGLCGVLFYGSVMRAGDDPDGLVDLVAIVDGYRAARLGRWHALLARLLPPNVYYLEHSLGERVVRCKYTVVSLATLERATSERTFQVYFWGRLAQPCRLPWTRDADARAAVTQCLVAAVRTFVAKVLPLAGGTFSASELWERGLDASYSTELRPERPGQAERLVAAAAQRYADLTAALTREGLSGLETVPGGYAAPLSKRRRRAATRSWRLRRWHGRTLNVLRLVKALATFDGGLDYVAWKVERHSGVKVEVSERARRHPLLAGWWTLWKLLRQGALR